MSDTRPWDALRERLAAAQGKSVRVGIVGAAANQSHGDSEHTNAEIGLFHEFGTRTIPERSFLRSTLRDPTRIEEFKALQARLLGAVLDGKMTADRALGLLGAWAAGAIQATITQSDIPPPLKPETVARKGSNKPLVDSGQLVRSISWEVV